MKRLSFSSWVYAACSKIPRGKVSTYADIAKAIGRPKASRAVGNALNKNRSRSVPCHRVVRSDRTVGGFARGESEKTRLLRKEGVRITRNLVDRSDIFRFSRRKDSS